MQSVECCYSTVPLYRIELSARCSLAETYYNANDWRKTIALDPLLTRCKQHIRCSLKIQTSLPEQVGNYCNTYHHHNNNNTTSLPLERSMSSLNDRKFQLSGITQQANTEHRQRWTKWSLVWPLWLLRLFWVFSYETANGQDRNKTFSQLYKQRETKQKINWSIWKFNSNKDKRASIEHCDLNSLASS